IHDRDGVVVSPPDAQRLTRNDESGPVHAAFALHVRERPDRRGLAPPPAGLVTHPRTLRRHATGDVSPAGGGGRAAALRNRYMRAGAGRVAAVISAGLPVGRARGSGRGQPTARRAAVAAGGTTVPAVLQGIEHAVSALAEMYGSPEEVGSGDRRGTAG